jgi:hypothetical protein
MSKLFDKGGIDGLLLSNLKCINNNAALALNTDGLPDAFTGSISTNLEDDDPTSLQELKFQLLHPEQYNVNKAQKKKQAEEQAHAEAMKIAAEQKLEQEKLESMEKMKNTSKTVNGNENVIDENDGRAVIRSIVENIVCNALNMEADITHSEVSIEPEGTIDCSDNCTNVLSLPYRTVDKDTLGHMIDITAYVKEINLNGDDFIDMAIIPQLDEWRSNIGIPILTQGSLDLMSFKGFANSSMEPHPFKETYNYNSALLPFAAHLPSSESMMDKRKAFFMPPIVPESTGQSSDGAVGESTGDEMEVEETCRTRGVTFSETVEESVIDGSAEQGRLDDDVYDCYDAGCDTNMPFDYEEEGDCDEDGNYIASQRRASLAAGQDVTTTLDRLSMSAQNRTSSGTRMSMINGELVDLNKNRPSLLNSKVCHSHHSIYNLPE